MKASELIKTLQQAIDEHGDLEISQDCAKEGLTVKTVGVYVHKHQMRLADDSGMGGDLDFIREEYGMFEPKGSE